MPTEPIEYRVLRDLQSALGTIATIDGYFHDVDPSAVLINPDVDVDARLGPDGSRPFLVLQPGVETWDYSDSSEAIDTFITLVFPVSVYWFNDTDQTTDEGKFQEFFRACADIERAIARDASRGFADEMSTGRPVDTRIVRRTLSTDDGGSQILADVEVEVRIQRIFGQPTGA